MKKKEKEKSKENKDKKKIKFRITLGMKASFSVTVMLAISGFLSISAMRYMFTIMTLNDEINDMYHIVNTGLELTDVDNLSKACEVVGNLYNSIPEEKKSDPESDAYLANFYNLNDVATGVDIGQIDRLLQVIKESNWEISDVGLGVLDDQNKRFVFVRCLDDTPTGYWDDFKYRTTVTISDRHNAIFTSEYDNVGTKDFYSSMSFKTIVPLNENAGRHLAGFIYIDSHGEELYFWSVFFLVVFLLIFVVIIILVWLVFGTLFKRMMIKPIKKLAGAARQWAASADKMGDKYYFRNLDINTHDEVQDLKDAMVSMENELHNYMVNLEVTTMEKLKLSSEIEVTARLQANMLPEKLKDKEHGIEIVPFMRPARLVGGDFYDYFMIDEKRYGIIIADVSDKGVPASMFMVVSRTLLNNDIVENPDDIAFAMRKSNEKLCERNGETMFVTAFVGIYDIETRTMSYVNAGHEDPIVYRKEKDKFETIMEEHDIILGVFDEAPYNMKEMVLNPGDKLFLYTDGVTEAMDIQDNLFGMDRLLNVLNSDTSRSGEQVICDLWDAISDFQTGKNQADDVTMLMIEV